MKKTMFSLLTVGALAYPANACDPYGINFDLLKTLNGSDAEIAAAAEEYRKRGARGLEDALAMRRLTGHDKFDAFLDQVAQQRDASRSGLYWHTDFDDALAEAEKSGKPVLSLRLLGKLDEEYSCANSRLFREVLYPDAAVNRHLREHFILHWKSVRPVPVMTIDYGDGRKLKRTITGNSAHYVLDSKGRVIDCLPGLYTPEKFLAMIKSAHTVAVANQAKDDRSHAKATARFHSERLEAIDKDISFRTKFTGLAPVVARLDSPLEMGDLTEEQWAKLASAPSAVPAFPPQILNAQVEQRAAAPAEAAALANELTVGKRVMETRILNEVRKSTVAELKRTKLDQAVAEDSVRNEFVLHRRVHERLANPGNHTAIDPLNQWVYAELFLMPDDDPWLGLHTPEVFTGLEDNGIVGR